MVLTDGDGNIIEDEFTIGEPDQITYASELNHVSCFGGADGNIIGEASGGISPFNYEWSNGQMEAIASDLPAGQYSLTVTDANNCSSESSFEITEPTELIVNLEEVMDAVNGESNGSIDITPQGGTMPYSYEWSNGANTEDVSELSEVEYFCTITDANACITVIGPVQIQNISALFELDKLQTFEVFPNPTNGWVNLKISLKEKEEVVLSIRDQFGKNIYRNILDADEIDEIIDLSGYAQGVYYVVVKSKGGTSTKKFVKL